MNFKAELKYIELGSLRGTCHSSASPSGRRCLAQSVRIDAVEHPARQENLPDQAGIAQLRLRLLRETGAKIAAAGDRQSGGERGALLESAGGGPQCPFDLFRLLGRDAFQRERVADVAPKEVEAVGLGLGEPSLTDGAHDVGRPSRRVALECGEPGGKVPWRGRRPPADQR